jgi:cell division septal protein FtsQ
MKKRSLYFVAGCLILGVLAYILGWSSLFTVSQIEVRGTDKIITSKIKLGEKLARVEPRVITAEYEKLEWVRTAQISRNWLNGRVVIQINERSPIAIFNNRAIDDEGVSFEFRGEDVPDLPRIQGSSIESAIKAAMFFKTLPIDITKDVKLVKVKLTNLYVLEIEIGNRKLEVLWGQDKESALKAQVYKALLVQPENREIHRIDLTAPHAPIVK